MKPPPKDHAAKPHPHRGTHRGGPDDGKPSPDWNDRIWTGTVYINSAAAHALAAAPIPKATISRAATLIAGLLYRDPTLGNGGARQAREERPQGGRAVTTSRSHKGTPPKRTKLHKGSIYEITTEHGTRMIIDRSIGADGFEYNRRIRLPAEHEAGTVNSSSADGTWRRLAAAFPRQHWRFDDTGARFCVDIGDRFVVHEGLRDYWITSLVVSVRELDQLPAELAAAQGYQDAAYVAEFWSEALTEDELPPDGDRG